MSGPGWRRIGPSPALRAWAQAARGPALAALAADAAPRRAGGTWAVGLDLLPNAPDGSVAGVALPWAELGLAPQPLHRAQLSAVWPGYPQPDPGEDASAHRFRLTRDSAHLDGLLPIGPERRRMLREPHGWILGLPLTEAEAGAAPLVVWEGSHLILRAALARAYAGHPPETWGDVDVTEAYAEARREAFRSCPRVELPARPGEATLLDRRLLHGVAPWAVGAKAEPDGRVIAYFRPTLPTVADWIGPDPARP